MNERSSLSYRMFVGVLLLSLVSVLVYTDRNYRSQKNLFGRDSRVANSTQPVPPPRFPDESAASPATERDSKQSAPTRYKTDFYAQRLLDTFKDAAVLKSEETMQPDGSLLKKDLLSTNEKYPEITREIRYCYDEVTHEWVAVSGSAWVSDQIMLGLKDGQQIEALKPILKDLNAELVQNLQGEGHHYLIQLKHVDGDDLEEKLSTLRVYGSIAYAEPNYFIVSTYVPNDSSFYNLWAMNNLGSGSGTSDADIDAVEAWDVTTGDANVLVAVIDTGIQISHPDLQGRIYYNLVEIENGLDDDGNGFVDDINGWNFYELDQGNNDVSDTTQSHGTHVAGIIAADGNNQIGVVGVSPGITILPVKIFNDDGGFTSDLIRGMDYARLMGASIINVSLGGSDQSKAEMAMIETLQKHGILLVTSSGNSGTNTDVNQSYPGSYAYSNIINVAASNWFDELESYSSWSSTSVDLCAPGTNILSTTAIDSYAYYSGTSMAAPHVTGVAALVKSIRSDWDANMLKSAILGTVDPIASASGKTVTGGRLNAFAAVTYARENTFFPNGLHIRIKSLANGLYINPDLTDEMGQLLADASQAGKDQTFEVVQVDESTYAFRSLHNGLYVTAEAAGAKPLSASRNEIGDWELFYPINLGDGHYAFRSKANGLFVNTGSQSDGYLIANAEAVSDSETFTIETLHLLPVGKMVVLQSAISGLYISPRTDGVLIPSETVAGLRDIFYVGLSMDGFLTLKSFETGNYVSARTEGHLPLHATATSVGDWEKFVAIAFSSGHIALRCKANGLFVTMTDTGVEALVANQSEMGSAEMFNSFTIEE